MDHKVQFRQLNANHSRTATARVLEISEKLSDPFVFMLQEPYINKGGKPCLLDCSQHIVCSSANNNRAAIYASRSLSIWPIDSFMSRDVAVALLETNKQEIGPIVIISVYWDREQRDVPVQMIEAIQFARSKGYYSYVAMDANAWSSAWGMDRENSRGLRLEELLPNLDLVLLNAGTVPTFERMRGDRYDATIIDITLVSAELDDFVDSWYVDEEPSLSDHKVICSSISVEEPPLEWKRSTKNTDWSKYYQEALRLHDELPVVSIKDKQTLLAELRNIYSIINRAANVHCKWVKVSNKPKSRPWWSDELRESRDRVWAAHKQWRRSKTAQNWEHYKSLQRKYNKALYKSQRNSFQDFVKETESISEMSRLNKILTKAKSRQVGMLRKPNGDMCTTPLESLNVLAEKCFKLSRPAESTNVDEEEDDLNMDFDIPNWMELDAIKSKLAEFAPNKSPGPDWIKPKMLSKLPDVVLSRLTPVFAAVYHSGFTPQVWVESRTIFIEKPGRDPTLPGSFRPIGLTSYVFKLLEKLVYQHLLDTSLKDNPLHKSQHGFRRGFSTETALQNVVSRLEKNMSKKSVVSLFLMADVEGAFDNVNPVRAKEAMIRRGFPPTMVNWYYHYSITRQTIVSIKGVEIRRILYLGTPQGGILSPLIWNVIMDELLQDLEHAGFDDVTAYADDLSLIFKDYFNRLTRLHATAQLALEVCERWAGRMGLKFSPSKSTIMIVKSSDRACNFRHLKLYGENISFVESCKYLGVIINSSLDWDEHIKKKLDSAKKIIIMTKGSLGRTWGPNPWLMRWAYAQCIRPMITYGALIWGHGLTAFHKRRMEVIQRMALMQCGNFRHGMPRETLNVMFGLPPLHIHIQSLASKSYLRLENNPAILDDTQEKGHWDEARKEVRQIGVSLQDADRIGPNPVLLPNKSFSVDPIRDPLRGPKRINIAVFTDGSRMSSDDSPRSGSGVAIYDHGLDPDPVRSGRYFLGEFATVYQAELFAIIKSVPLIKDYLTERNLYGERVRIYVDNQSVLATLDNPIFHTKLSLRCRNALNYLGRLTPVSLHWIKAHAEFEGNEKADELAKAGALLQDVPPEDIPLAVSQVFNFVEARYKGKWTQHYTSCSLSQSKVWFPGLDLVKSKHVAKLSRNSISRFGRFISGHCFLRRQNVLTHLRNDTIICRLCGEDEERAEHIIRYCPALWRERHDAFGVWRTFLDENNPEWKVNQISKFVNSIRVQHLEKREEGDIVGADRALALPPSQLSDISSTSLSQSVNLDSVVSILQDNNNNNNNN